ncbi:MAG: Ig-like domain-containing protein [Verrucomicrobia bacterium]|nr:Ig-like domain-containing protein [Verrucomicrobiota bacterium]
MKTYSRSLLAVFAAAFIGGSYAPGRAGALDLMNGFEGINSGWIPADPIIAAGPRSLVTMVSGRIAIFSKQGAKLFEQNLGAGGFWSAQGADQVAEPWVIFDPDSRRFIAIAAEFGSAKGRLYLAVSNDSEPRGSADWHKYRLDRTGTHQNPSFPGVPTYPDYAKVGVDSDAIYITSVHFAKNQSITASFSHAEMFALEKTPLLSGGLAEAADAIVYDAPVLIDPSGLPISIHPAVVFGPAPAMYFVQSVARFADNKVVVHGLANVLSAPTHVVSPVTVAAFDRPPNVPQRGSTDLLENIDARLMSAVVRNGSLWTAHGIRDPLVDSESLVRWYQFDVTGLPNTDAVLLQSGNVDPGAGRHAWLPHINVDARDNMGLVFSVGGAGEYASIGYTGQRVTDPDGETLPVRIARAGAGPYTQGGWGEYSGLAIDPDGSTFWLFHQYPTKQKTWRTFVGAFEVAGPPPPSDPLHCGDLDGIGANSGKNWKATVTATIHDGDHHAIEGATVSIAWSTGATATGVTDATGKATFTLNSISKQVAAVALAIQGVSYLGLTYSLMENHDPDADSDGTTITVNKP